MDAFSFRPNGRGFTFYCTRLNNDGTSGRSVVANHPYKADPCRLPETGGMEGSIPPHPQQPVGFRLASYSLVSRTDGRGDLLAVWDDWPNGGGYTHGLFYAVANR